MKKITMYADVVNGKFDMTLNQLIAQVKENPFFSNPEDVAFVNDEGILHLV